jgi:hypothetical protein
MWVVTMMMMMMMMVVLLLLLMMMMMIMLVMVVIMMMTTALPLTSPSRLQVQGRSHAPNCRRGDPPPTFPSQPAAIASTTCNSSLCRPIPQRQSQPLAFNHAPARACVVTPLQNHGMRVLLRLLARALPSNCLAELFGCLMNVAADVGGQLELLNLSFFPAVFAAAPGLGVLESVLEGREEQRPAGWCEEDYSVEFAGMVRNMLCATNFQNSTGCVLNAHCFAGTTASAPIKPFWLAQDSLIT